MQSQLPVADFPKTVDSRTVAHNVGDKGAFRHRGEEMQRHLPLPSSLAGGYGSIVANHVRQHLGLGYNKTNLFMGMCSWRTRNQNSNVLPTCHLMALHLT